jgi:AraC-like DNA-binding protein
LLTRAHGSGYGERVDPLADILELSRVRGGLLGNVEARAPWGLELPPNDGASFHAVTAGTAWVQVGEGEPFQLMPGDLLLLPSGVGHRVLSAPGAVTRLFDRTMKQELMSPDGDLLLEGAGATTTFICAGYRYDMEVAEPLLRLLPDVVYTPADPVDGRDVAALVSLLAGEVGARRAGSGTAIARLIDLLLIAALRRWNARRPEGDGPSWLSALRDPAIAAVLAAIHARPAHPWTLEELAGEVHLSRATLARRFTRAVGEAPLAYLTQWRMHLAAQQLRNSAATVESIGRAVGYTSEFAFNRAFTRVRGVPPGRYRRQQAA